MKSIDLIKSFMSQAKWGQNATDGRPYRGIKWLSTKQINFLWTLCKKEDSEGIDYFGSFSWEIDGYKCEMGRVAPNGCVQMKFTNLNGV